jgi:hypothetical protein
MFVLLEEELLPPVEVWVLELVMDTLLVDPEWVVTLLEQWTWTLELGPVLVMCTLDGQGVLVGVGVATGLVVGAGVGSGVSGVSEVSVIWVMVVPLTRVVLSDQMATATRLSSSGRAASGSDGGAGSNSPTARPMVARPIVAVVRLYANGRMVYPRINLASGVADGGEKRLLGVLNGSAELVAGGIEALVEAAGIDVGADL